MRRSSLCYTHVSFLLFFLLLVTFKPLWSQSSCSAISSDHITNGDFETLESGCSIPTSAPLNAAFNLGCVPGWYAGNGTPSICNATSHSPQIPASHGNNFACLSSNWEEDPKYTKCDNEAIVQDLSLCVGDQYSLSFDYRWISEDPGRLKVYLASTLITTPGDPGSPCISNPGSWLELANIQMSNIGTWQSFTVFIGVMSTANSKLVFFAEAPTNVTSSSCNIGIDFVRLTCTSALIPQITANYADGGFTFTAITNTVAGLSVASYCWDFGDGTTSNLQNPPSHSFDSPGDHTVCLTITDNCGCVSTTCTTVNSSDCGCGQTSLLLSANSASYELPTGNLIDRDIIIPAGAHVTITGRTLLIKTTCKFVVLRGASLTVNNSKLTNFCDGQKWQGIVVWGNAAVNHASVSIPNNATSDPGVAVITNHSQIMNAQTALEPQRWWNDNRNNTYFNSNYPGAITDYWGGIVRGISSNFYNNRKSADIGYYNTIFDNASLFTGCTFSSSATTIGNGTGAEGVTLWNNKGVVFTNCTFNFTPARGITSANAGMTVKHCTFTNNYQGIQTGSAADFTFSTNIGTGSDLDINTFSKNKFGIWADGINKLRIWNNNFSNNELSGFRASSYAGFNVWNNNFEENDQGITLLNTGGNGQDINCNTHQDDHWAIFASADCHGVTFRNNSYDTKNADVLLQGVSGIAGNLPDQGADGAAVFNLFSENESDNDIITEATTDFFTYYPPSADLINDPAVAARLLPDCDDDDACIMANNYHNFIGTFGFQDCVPASVVVDGPTCTNRSCLDSLNTRLTWLKQQITLGQGQYKGQAQRTERRFLSDKRSLTEQWFLSGNMTLVEQVLNAYNQTDDKRILYGFYLRQKNLTQAAIVLASLPNSTTEDVWFRAVQQIYMSYLGASTGPFVATHTQDSLLETVGTSILHVGANARTVYYLLHGIWLEPVVEAEERQAILNAQIAKATILRLVPNPASNGVSMRLPGTDGVLQLYDLFGKLLRTIEISSMDCEINTATLPNGVYLMYYSAKNGSHAEARLVVQH